MKVVVLMENICDREELEVEHGLSLYIESEDKKILLDTGSSGKFVKNAERLGINLSKVDMAILSHGHYDHVGGLLDFFNVNDKAKIYLKTDACKDYYAGKLGLYKYIGIDKTVLDKYMDRLVLVDKLQEIHKNMFIITDLIKEYPMPEGNKSLYKKEGNKYVKDDFNHELMLVIREVDGIVTFTGCSHNGIMNMIKTAKYTFKDEHIKAIVGGFHLMTVPSRGLFCMKQEKVDVISNFIASENIGKVYTGHCTGKEGYDRLKKILGHKVEYITVGSEINI
ncbi:MBL fold metallo-hydrolase [Clostridium lundense]|uniref:MBL fold metallo-hydrolase n=1 Tax=Clostridium lundense TaxID=319475 RepID=UPI000484A677|nr:MBL fold metallo-hydrolase [Clostridium lundense]